MCYAYPLAFPHYHVIIAVLVLFKKKQHFKDVSYLSLSRHDSVQTCLLRLKYETSLKCCFFLNNTNTAMIT